MAYRIARSLDRLRGQINAQWPKRNKASDGWIGDAKHATTNSDHNPWVKHGKTGIVTALDVTHNPAGGPDVHALAEHLRQKRDPRLKYVISDGRIFSSTVSPWVWRKYTGSNPHRTHVHVSVNSAAKHFDDEGHWDLTIAPGAPSSPPPADDSPKNRPVLRKGSRGEDVKTVQRLLVVSVDGIFGDNTENAVKRFQKFEKLAQDGVVGPLTWAKLDLIEQVPVPLDYDEPHELSEPLSEQPPQPTGVPILP